MIYSYEKSLSAPISGYAGKRAILTSMMFVAQAANFTLVKIAVSYLTAQYNIITREKKLILLDLVRSNSQI